MSAVVLFNKPTIKTTHCTSFCKCFPVHPGIEVNDVLTHINGVSVSGFTVQTALETIGNEKIAYITLGVERKRN